MHEKTKLMRMQKESWQKEKTFSFLRGGWAKIAHSGSGGTLPLKGSSRMEKKGGVCTDAKSGCYQPKAERRGSLSSRLGVKERG